MNFIFSHIDGNWIDIGSVITGFVYMWIQHARCRKQSDKSFLSRETGIDFANGVALFPLLVLAFSVLSSELVKSLLEASKISLSVAGVFAALAILEEK